MDSTRSLCGDHVASWGFREPCSSHWARLVDTKVVDEQTSVSSRLNRESQCGSAALLFLSSSCPGSSCPSLFLLGVAPREDVDWMWPSGTAVRTVLKRPSGLLLGVENRLECVNDLEIPVESVRRCLWTWQILSDVKCSGWCVWDGLCPFPTEWQTAVTV